MKFDPILPVWILVVFLILFGGGAVFFLIRSREQLKEKLLIYVPMLAIVVLLFFVGLRPMKEEHNAEIKMSNLDVLFVVDTTVSMWADDYPKGTRMAGVKDTLTYILDALPGANFALITFDNHSYIRAPFTQDRETLDLLIENIDLLSPYTSVGSDMNIPYNDMASLLRSSAKKENRRAIVFFISDGEITTGTDLQSYGELKDLIHGGAVLGYGTREGGRMRYEGSYVYDYESYGDALSVIDEMALNKIASDLGIEYLHMTGQPLVGQIITKIQSLDGTIVEKRAGYVSYTDTYYYYVWPLLLLLAAELLILLRTEKKA